MLPAIGEVRPWADPEVVSINRLPMRAPTRAFPTVAEARRDSGVDGAGISPWRRPLDGRWHFRLFDSPDAVSPAAITDPVDATKWQKVAVPGNWTLHGVGDDPIYTNVQMPFAGPPPSLPDRNPTGVYRRTVKIPAAFLGKQIVLHIGGAESVHAVYLNGAFVGYGTDSRLASEYDITDQARRGDNDLAIVVVRWSAQSYVEDQDHWWMAGLHREVFVEARNPTHVSNLDCVAGFRAHDGVGTVDVTATVGGRTPPPAGWQTRLRVETLRGRALHPPHMVGVPHRFDVPYVFTGHDAVANFEIPHVQAWSAECPTQYRVVCELFDPTGRLVEAHAQLIGFRSVAVDGNRLLVNGEPVWIFGVNRHDHHPDRGTAVTVDDMRDDLLAMRRHNITAVRCSHYPNDPRFLDLCDEIGLYVVDEANLESHAYNTSLCNDGRYRSTWLARGARMVERDRNHPSVILWSLGNEAGDGSNHDAEAAWIRRTDPTRPIQYEGAIFHGGWADGGRMASDVVCPMYPSHEDTAGYSGDRPFIMCEYSHAMGNSNGSLADYWDTITSTPGLQGGFIWEWKDHGITATLPNRRRGFAYGGQFGETIHDGNFVADGLMSSDLVPHPAIQEVEWVYRPVTTERRGAQLVVTNRRSFADLSDLSANWELNAGGEVLASGELDVAPVAPGTAVKVPLPCDRPTEADAHLVVTWRQRSDTQWAPAGHVVACDQMQLTGARRPTSSSLPVVVSSGPLADLMRSEPMLSIFRAPVDNDGYKLMPHLHERIGVGGTSLRSWQHAGIDGGAAEDHVVHDHRIDAVDGAMIHHHTVVVPVELDDLGRIGAVFELAAGFDRLRWFGRGPLENYPDRNRGAMMGTWVRPVDAAPYLVPQEFGLRTDCRWFEFENSATGDIVRLDVLRPVALHISATRFTDADLYDAAHETDLRSRRTLIVHVDVAHRGLGTASCGPDILPQYRIAPGRHTFSYRLTRTRR